MKLSVDLSQVWQPYDKQADFIFGTQMFQLFLGGVGSGKSHALCCASIARALANPGSVGALLGRTEIDLRTVLLPNLFERLDDLQRASKVNWIKDYDKGNMCLRLLNDSVMWFRPYNQIAKLRGLTLTWAAADEVEWSQADPEEIWTVVTGRLRGKGPYPGFIVATSPNGMRGITKRFVDAQRHYLDAKTAKDADGMKRWGSYRVTSSTSFDNPYLPPHFFESLRSMSRRRYLQEVEGKVLRPLHAVLSLEPRHVIEWSWREHRELPRAYGVDWGGQDHHVAVMAQVMPSGRWVIADELICDGMPRGHFHERLARWIDGHGQLPPKVIGADRAVPQENQLLQQRYRQTHVRWMEGKEEQSVTLGLETLRDLLDPHEGEPMLVFAASLSQTVQGPTAGILPALRGYCYHLDDIGQPTSKPKKDNTNDHAVDCLRYAVLGTADMIELHGGRRLSQRGEGDRRPDAARQPGLSSRLVH